MPKITYSYAKGKAGLKKKAKAMPKNVVKQIPNAALILTGGITAKAATGAVKAAKAARAVKKAKTIPKKVKVSGQKKKMKVNNWRGATQHKARGLRKTQFRVVQR